MGIGDGVERTPPQGNWASWSSLKPRAKGESSVKWEVARGRRKARARVVVIMVLNLYEIVEEGSGFGSGCKGE